MQRTIDSFFSKAMSDEETIPREWRENPLPKSPVTPKRPVGRPKKRLDEEAREEIIQVREDDAILDGPSPKRRKYALYTPKEKQEILEEVELCGLRATARKWKIAPSKVTTWKKEQLTSRDTKVVGRSAGVESWPMPRK